MYKTLIILILGMSLGGCLLDTETCGFEFVERGGTCVPRNPAPPYRQVAMESADSIASPRPDGALAPVESPYESYGFLRLEDRTPIDQAMLSDDAPGADIDAVVIYPPGGEVPVAVIGQIIEVKVGDSDRLFGEDAPLVMLAGPDGLHFSLGGEGGMVLAELNFSRTLRVGDVMRVVEVPDVRGFADSVEVALCTDPEGLDCLVLGQTPPSREGEFVLPQVPPSSGP